MVPQAAPCCRLARDTILIRDDASAYTLIHEFVQTQLRSRGTGPEAREDVELRFALAFRRLAVYQRRIDADPARLADPLWRRDLLAAQSAVADLLFDRIRIGQSQEAIVEKILALEIDERSPYFDAARRAQGRGYGEAMIDNAIDLFNEVQRSVESAGAVVAWLRADAGPPPAGDGVPDVMSEREARGFAAESRAVLERLERVRAEIEALKRFYVR